MLTAIEGPPQRGAVLENDSGPQTAAPGVPSTCNRCIETVITRENQSGTAQNKKVSLQNSEKPWTPISQHKEMHRPMTQRITTQGPLTNIHMHDAADVTATTQVPPIGTEMVGCRYGEDPSKA